MAGKFRWRTYAEYVYGSICPQQYLGVRMPLYANFRTLELCFHEQFTIKIYSVPGTRIAVTRAMVSGLATSISGYTNACCSFGGGSRHTNYVVQVRSTPRNNNPIKVETVPEPCRPGVDYLTACSAAILLSRKFISASPYIFDQIIWSVT